MTTTQWVDPRERIWGFHIHQELDIQDFGVGLVIQKACAKFLTLNQITVTSDDAIKPGYGPHLNYMWELRVENEKDHVLEKLGLALSYMSINRHELSAYIHPVMHEPSVDEEKLLRDEGEYNQKNALWFSHRVPQHQDFFFNPPKNSDGTIKDTRTHRVISIAEKEILYQKGLLQLQEDRFKSQPRETIHGYHIHMDFETADTVLALSVFENFLLYLKKNHIHPSSHRIYAPYENGPHVSGGWEVKFEKKSASLLLDIGVAVGWLMCNRQGLSVFMHPVTWCSGDVVEELHAHEKYYSFMGEMPALDLRFFSDQIAFALTEI